MREGSIPVESYARLRAEMDAGLLRDEVLARAHLGAAEWTKIQKEWLERMGAELELGRFELSNRYNRAFLERQQELAAAEAKKAPAPQPELEPSSPELAPPLPAAPFAALPPMMTAPPVVAAPAPVAAPPMTSTAGSKRTGMIDLSAINARAVPFMQGGGGGAQPEPPSTPPPQPKHGHGRETVALPAISFEDVKRALPFEKGAPRANHDEPGTHGAVVARAADAVSAVPPHVAGPSAAPSANVDERAAITALHLDDPLPFTKASESASSPPGGAVAAGPSGGDGLTLEQFASLRAELVTHPTEPATVLARYCVSAEHYGILADAWQARFAADRALEQRYDGLVREYVQWLGRRS
jgi:hypothetical protein